VRDGRLVDTDDVSKLSLAELLGLAQRGDASVDWTAQAAARSRSSFHQATVDRRSTFVNIESTTDLPKELQLCEPMGDARHKDRPPEAPLEPVTEDFRAAVLGQLAANRLSNATLNLKPGDVGYKICSHAELAAVATDGDKTMLNRIIGPAKSTTKIKLVKESRFVAAIRTALGFPQPVVEMIEVPADRAATIRMVAALPEAQFETFERAVNDAISEIKRKSR
jgi:hypothetical protein